MWKKILWGWLFCLISLPAFSADFSGEWSTTYGYMKLKITGSQAEGSYLMNGVENKIFGKINGDKFSFQYKESRAEGEGWFKLDSSGEKFSGEWRESGASSWQPWVGKRFIPPTEDFAGIWETSYGRMRLIKRDKNQIEGIYASGGVNHLKGKLSGKRFEFTYQEKEAAGEGWFELSADGQLLKGKWRKNNTQDWQDWTGKRLQPIPGRVWLYVVEARWERLFEQKEYAFGDMLKTFFDRTPNVEVRRRFFTDAQSLERWLEEIALVPEPVLLSLASHGEEDGLRVDGHTIPGNVIEKGIRYADNLLLVHFSACLMMKADYGKKLHKALQSAGNPVPVSGYKTSVDWSASAIFEMTYFDLILSRGLSVKEAAAAALKLFPIAGKNQIPGVPIRAAGFDLIP